MILQVSVTAYAANVAPNDIAMNVTLDAAEQSGSATAVVRIHARRETVWSLITSRTESMQMVPGLVVCDVLETAPDHSWQKIHQVMNYSWFVPKVSYDIQAAYDRPTRVSYERIGGDLRTLHGAWQLDAEGDDTLVHYSVTLVPGFWVPQFLVRSVLRQDLPKMLRALRSRAEAGP